MTTFNLGQKVRNKTLGLTGRVTAINGDKTNIRIYPNWDIAWWLGGFVTLIDVNDNARWEPVPVWQYRASFRRIKVYQYYIIPTLSLVLVKNSKNVWIILIDANWIDWNFAAKIWRAK